MEIWFQIIRITRKIKKLLKNCRKRGDAMLRFLPLPAEDKQAFVREQRTTAELIFALVEAALNRRHFIYESIA